MSNNRKIQYDSRRKRYFVQIQRDGVRKYFLLGSSKKEARAKSDQIDREIAAGLIVFGEEAPAAPTPDGRPDIEIFDLVVLHLEWLQAHRSPGTFKQRRHYVFRFLEFLGVGRLQSKTFEPTRSMLVSELTRSKLTEFHLWARRTSNNSGPNAGNQALRQVKTMLKWGEEEELCELPFRRFPAISEVPPETKRVGMADLDKLLRVAPDNLIDLIRFGLLTGLRPQELRQLKVDQVIRPDSGICYARIERHKTAGRTSERTVRTVPLGKEALEILERNIATHPRSPYVFLNGSETPYTKDALRNRMIRWCRRAGIPDITPYALRHTFASLESDAHIESTALARLMGHSTVRTLARYVSNSHEHDLEAVQAAQTSLNNALAKARQETSQ